MPQVGDNDNGRLLVFSESEVTDFRYLLVYAAIFFRDRNFKINEFGYNESALWLFGKKGVPIWENLEGGYLSDIKSISFKNGGFLSFAQSKFNFDFLAKLNFVSKIS